MRLIPNRLRLRQDDTQGDPFVLAFQGDSLLLKRTQDDPGVGLPCPDDIATLGADLRFSMNIGDVEGHPLEACDVPADLEIPEDWRLEDVRSLFGIVDEKLFANIGKGAHLIHWRRTSKHCGVCGSITDLVGPDFALECASCGFVTFPRIAPAVLALVEDGPRCVLARGTAYQAGMFSCLAGFVAPGETLEQAIRREVVEEVALEITDLRYFGSQPWPYPDGLMVGFHAKYAGGEIRLRDGEIREARWFDVDELPLLPGSFSLARQLIDDFRARNATVR
jgi:NAD+ diphosphatase